MGAEEFAGLGFALGSVKGVRSFKIDKFGRLTGVTYEKVWRPGENNAECLRDDSYAAAIQSMHALINQMSQPWQYTTTDTSGLFGKRGRGRTSSIPPAPILPPVPTVPEVPAHSFESCACGFYGYFDGSDDFHDKARITAVVEAYGETVIGTRGFRAMKARILAIRVKAEDDGVTGSMARKLAKNYAGVAIFDNFDEMVKAFPPDVSLEPSPETDPDFWTRS